MKQASSLQGRFFSFVNSFITPSPEFSAKQKYGTCNHLISLLQDQLEEKLSPQEFEILTSSELGEE